MAVPDDVREFDGETIEEPATLTDNDNPTTLTDEARTALEDKVGAALDKFNGETSSEDLADEGLDPAEVVSEDDPPKDGEDPTTDGKQDDDPPAEAEGEEAVESDDSPTLPDSYRRSLKAYGWDDDAIDKNLRILGPQFIDTASRIHANRNQEVASWAEAGRRARQDQGNPDTLALGRTNQGQPPAGLPPVDIKKLAEQFGEEELVAAIAGPVNEVIAKLNAILPQVEQGSKAIKDAEEQGLIREVEAFFSGSELKPYAQVYGAGEKSLTNDQLGHRNQVLEEADALMAGAKFQGRKLSVGEALLIAHDHVSIEFKEQAVRTSLQKEAKKRNRGITAPPSNRQAPTGRIRTREQLAEKIGPMLAKAFGTA